MRGGAQRPSSLTHTRITVQSCCYMAFALLIADCATCQVTIHRHAQVRARTNATVPLPVSKQHGTHQALPLLPPSVPPAACARNLSNTHPPSLSPPPLPPQRRICPSAISSPTSCAHTDTNHRHHHHRHQGCAPRQHPPPCLGGALAPPPPAPTTPQSLPASHHGCMMHPVLPLPPTAHE